MSRLCSRIKREIPECTLVLGGPHPTARPQETLGRIPSCDVVVRGEADHVLPALASALRDVRPLTEVLGIVFRGPDGQVLETEESEAPQNLDELPFPDREAVMHHYRDRTYSSFVYGSPSDLLMTSRGCPFQCRFCFKVCVKYRSHSPNNVLAEIDWVMEHVRPRSIQFMDDSFTIQRERAHAILDGLVARKYPVRIKIRSRVNAVDESLFRKMKRAGVDTIVFGLESGSQAMFDAFDKRTKVRQNIAACRMARRAGLHCLGDMILFYPGENKNTLAETKRFIKTANPTAVKFYVPRRCRRPECTTKPRHRALSSAIGTQQTRNPGSDFLDSRGLKRCKQLPSACVSRYCSNRPVLSPFFVPMDYRCYATRALQGPWCGPTCIRVQSNEATDTP